MRIVACWDASKPFETNQVIIREAESMLSSGGADSSLVVLACVTSAEAVSSAEQSLSACKHDAVVLLTEGSSVGESIVRFCDNFSPHLVCVGTRANSAVERLLLGSVSSHVLESVKCAVLLAK